MAGANIGELAAIGTAFSWSLSAVYFENAGKKIGSLSVNYIRLITGFIFLSIYTYFSRGYLLPIDASGFSWSVLSISGLIGLFIGDLFLFQSYLEVGSRVSMLIMASSPPFSALMGYFIFNEKLKLINILGMSLTLLGIAMVILSRDSGQKVKVKYSKKGLFFAFMGSLGQAVGLIFSKLGMGDYDPFAATQIRIIAAFISFTIFITYLKKWGQIGQAIKNRKALLETSIGSIFGPFVGVGLSLASLKYIAAGISATITSITPVTIIPFSIIFFKEKIQIKEVLGAIITVIGVAILFLV